MLSDYILLAIKNLKKRGIRSWLTMLGIFIGIAAVVSLISLGNALQQAITGQFGSLDPNKLIIENIGTGFGPPGSTAVRKLTDHDLEVISSVSGVEYVIPRLIRVVEVNYNKISKFRYVGSMPPDKDQIKVIEDSLNLKIISGKALELSDKNKVVLGNGFLKKEFDKEIRVGTKLNIQGKNFEVIGILEKSSSFIFNDIILMSESDVKEILNIDNEIDAIVVQVDNKDKIQEIVSEIEQKLRRDRKEKLGEEDFSVQTPVQAVSSINTILNIINLIVSGIAFISLFIGGIGIANTMFTSVLERTREIGIMKAIGAKNSDILLIFLIEAGMLGLIGGIVGAIIGLSLAYFVSSIASSALGGLDFKVVVSFPLLFAAISFSLVIGVISGVFPAYQASKLSPVEALRK